MEEWEEGRKFRNGTPAGQIERIAYVADHVGLGIVATLGLMTVLGIMLWKFVPAANELRGAVQANTEAIKAQTAMSQNLADRVIGLDGDTKQERDLSHDNNIMLRELLHESDRRDSDRRQDRR